jgi:hypothetical protein
LESDLALTPAEERALATDLTANGVFLLVQRALLGAGNAAAVLARHKAFLATDRPVFGVQSTRLPGSDLAFSSLLIDAPILVGEAGIHLGAAGMSLVPGFRRCGADSADDGDKGKRDGGDPNSSGFDGHVTVPFLSE